MFCGSAGVLRPTVMGGAEQSEYSTRQNWLRPFTLHDMQRSKVDKLIIKWSLNAKGNLIINNIPTDSYRCKLTGGSHLRLRQIEILAWCLQVFLSLPIGCPVVRGSWHLRAGRAQSLQSIPVFLSGNQTCSMVLIKRRIEADSNSSFWSLKR